MPTRGVIATGPQMRSLVANVNTGLRFPWGIDLGIAF
jgi:hypothetical protein